MFVYEPFANRPLFEEPMPISFTHRRLLVFVLSLAAFCVSSVALAYTQKTDCEWFHGQCLIPLKPILSPEEAAQINRPFTLAEKPIELVEYDLRNKTETRRPLTIEELQAANTLFEATAAAPKAAGQKALTVVAQPWNDPVLKSIVKLIMVFGQYMAACSGTLVGKHTVLTAGHCVYAHADEREGFNYTGWAGQITAYVEFADGVSPYAGVNAAFLAAPSNWQTSQDFRSDLGVIQLETDVGVVAGYQTASGNAKRASFAYAGYPGTDGYDGSDLAQGVTTPSSVDSYNVCHYNTLIQGQSGGPGWHPGDNPVTIVAVNSYSSGAKNCSCRVQSWALDQISKYEAASAGPAKDYWTCDFGKFHAGDACDCGCGFQDADCLDASLAVKGCKAGESCSLSGVCACQKQCDGRKCGSDGCGGNCGTCSGDRPICEEATGKCTGCDDAHPCQADSLCIRGTCQLNCPVLCKDKQCGAVGECVCGTCAEGSTCNEATFACVSGTCTPNCAGRACGSDGCTGTCGSCSSGKVCNAAQQCETGTPGDGDTTPQEDGDAIACAGACADGTASYCLSSKRLCNCEVGLWIEANCQTQCAVRGLASKGCGENALGEDVCFCATSAADGDLDGNTPNPQSGSGGGCRAAGDAAGFGLFGLLLALFLWRKRQSV